MAIIINRIGIENRKMTWGIVSITKTMKIKALISTITPTNIKS